MLEVADIDENKISNVVRTHIERRKISLLKDVEIRKRFEGRLTELVGVGAPNLCGHIEEGVLEASDEVCGRKRGLKKKQRKYLV